MKKSWPFILILFLTSCLPSKKGELEFVDKLVNDDKESIFSLDKSTVSLEDEPLDFSTLSEKILIPKCVKCHNESDAELGVDLSTYESTLSGGWFSTVVDLDSLANSGLYTETRSGAMPPGRKSDLSQDELNFIKRWIEAGAPKEEKVTFKMISDQILVPKCVKCHNSSDAELGVDLSSYESTLSGGWFSTVVDPDSFENSGLYTETKSGAMPPGKRDKLSIRELELIKKWIENGIPK